ncbi:Lsr2 family protein [Arthrobacter sp. ISL-95]|uniref:histone-like nucleoid-structuring protein Lsr2 n=1 Tax=Arthrobacter sp. ISL-95 TaxID=2819116 RepID=UPI001BEB20C0|nr:Lsr2 family protein [Arthrobacter sp. ISL-95]MBT2588370.1 Lsr2 family protein [Arthrobacter sp. ISL-95]
MATKTIITLLDDLDGSEAAETVRFELDGIAYDMELNSRHAEELRTALAPFVQAARKAAPTRGRRRTGHGNAGLVRAWARENGIPIASKGTINAEILERYYAAH